MKKFLSARTLSFAVGLFLLAGTLLPILFAVMQTAVRGAEYTENILSNCDTLEGWTVVDGPGALTVDTAGRQEGAGAVRFFDQAGGTVGELGKSLFFETPRDLSLLYSDARKALQIWVKVSDVSALNQLVIDIVDADGMSGTALTWDWGHMKRYEYAPAKFEDNKWVKLLITPDSRNYTHGAANAPDFSKIKLIAVRAYKSASLPLSVSVDNIAVVDAGFSFAVDSCDTLNGWSSPSGWMRLFTSGQTEGAGMISISNNVPNPTNIIEKVFAKPVNLMPITRADDMQLEIWLKVDNPDGVDNIRVDLASSAGVGGDGRFTYAGFGKAWSFPGSSFPAGQWKKITVRASDPAFHEWNAAGSIDYSDIKYLAVITNTKNNGLVDVHVDNIRLSAVGASYVLDDGTDPRNWTAEAWRGTPSAGGAGHNGGMSVKIADTNPAVPYYSMSLLPRGGVDLSAIRSAEDKELVFMVKAADPSALTLEGAYVILSSEGSLSGTVFNWTKGVRYQIPKEAFQSGGWVRFAVNPSTPVNHDWGGYQPEKTVNIQLYVPLAGTLTDFFVSEVALTERASTPPEEPGEPEEPEQPEATIIGGNDGLNGWIATSGVLSLDTNAPKEGTASVRLAGNPDQALMMKKLPAKPEDLSLMGVKDGKALTFWVRVENVENLQKLEIDLADETGVDENGNLRWTPGLKRWIFTPERFESGEWVKLQITDFDSNLFNPWGNSLNYSKIVYFGVNAYLVNGGTNLALSFDDFTLADPAPAASVAILDSHDTVSGWTPVLGEVVLNDTDPKEGSGAAVLRGAPEEALKMYKIPTAYENLAPMGVKNDKALSMWVRVDNPAALRELQIDLADHTGLNPDGSLKWNQGLKRWIFTPERFEAGGWVKLSLTDFDANIFNVWNNTLDYSKIAYIGITAFVTAPGQYLKVEIDHIHLGDVPPPEPVRILDSQDTLRGWVVTLGEAVLNKTDPKEGSGSVVLRGAPDEALKMQKIPTDYENLSAMGVKNDKALSLWVRVKNAGALRELQIDLADHTGLNPDGSLKWNQGLKRWIFTGDDFESGEWVKLSLTDFDANIFNVWNNTLDYSKIAYISITAFVKSAGQYLEIDLDDIHLGEVPPVPPVTLTDNCDKIWGFTASLGSLAVDKTAPAEGKANLKLYGAPEEALAMHKVMSQPQNVAGMAVRNDKALTLWIRVSDTSKIKGVSIDLTDVTGLNPDGSRIWNAGLKRWEFSPDNFKSGEWVKIQLTDFDPNIFNIWNNTLDYGQIIRMDVVVFVTAPGEYVEFDFDNITYEDFTGELKLITADDNCDTHAGWNAKIGQTTYGNVNPQEGTGYLTLYGAPDEALIMQKKLDVTDSFVGLDMLGSRKYTFWVRVKDASVISALNIDLVSAGGLDDNGERNWQNCKRWIFSGSTFRSGEWVKLEITGLDTNMEPDWAHNILDYDNIVMIYISVYSTESKAYMEVDFDDFKVERFPEGAEIPGDEEEPELSLPDIVIPEVTAPKTAKFLNYKVVVAKGTTLKQLLSALALQDDYTVRVVDGENEIGDTAVLKTGMWLCVSIGDLDVAYYYVEIGDPTDTRNVKDVPMDGRPDGGRPGDTDNPPTGDRFPAALMLCPIFAAVAGCLAKSNKRKTNRN